MARLTALLGPTPAAKVSLIVFAAVLGTSAAGVIARVIA